MPLLEIDRNPDPHVLRRFGAIACAVFGALAACAFFERFWFAGGLGAARLPVSAALLAVALYAALASLVRPRANRALYLGLSALAYPIGFVVSYCVLALLFFGVVTPIGIALRVLGRDPMTRAFERDAPSYWASARGPRPRSSYLRQF